MNEYKGKMRNFLPLPLWVLVIIVITIILLFSFIKVDASDSDYLGTNTFEYNGTEYSYYLINSFTYDYGKDYSYQLVFDSPVYATVYTYGSTRVIQFCSFEQVSYYTITTQLSTGNVTFGSVEYFDLYTEGDSDIYQKGWISYYENTSIPFSFVPDANYGYAFISYFSGDEFEEIVTMPDLSDIEFIGTYSEYIPTPKITVDNDGYGFGFNNATDDYYFELQGRWYSVDDIELFKENVVWQYKYSTIIKSNLSTWVSASDKVLAIDGYDFSELGSDFFNDFLDSYPVDDRTYYGGTNAIGNYFSGYSDAMDTLKMLLAVPESLYNGLEVYIRYFTIDNEGNVNYGKWCHWYDALADSSGSSGSEWDDKENMHNESQSESGLTTEQKESLESSGNSKSDTDVITNYINNSSDEIASQQIWNIMESMINAMGIFPSLVSTVLGWLPSWLINMIAVSLGCMIVLRFLGR